MKGLRSGASFIALCALTAGTAAFAQTAGQTPTPPANSTPQADVQATQGSPDRPTVPGTTGAGATQGTQTPESSQQPISNSNATASAGAGAAQGGAGEIVVTGIRQSLANAQSIKRNSDTVVDAITSEDIGALPDRSVSEALQRVPGVDINHFAGGNDPDHFSVEGSGVTIRGLNFVRPEFNGRDVFEASGGQGISFADISPSLIGNVQVYKNVTAEMIEGGLAGTVNLNTRLPLDSKGLHINFDAEANHSDFIKKTTPVGALVISDTFDTGIGTIGVLGAASYSQLKNRADGMQVSNFQTRDTNIVLGANTTTGSYVCRNPLPSDVDDVTQVGGYSNTYDPCRANETDPTTGKPVGAPDTTPGGDGLADDASTRYAPVGASFRTQDYNHVRRGYAGALQWESTDRRALLTAQFTRTESESKWNEKTFETAGDLSDYNTYPMGCQQAGSDFSHTYAKCPVGGFQNYQYDDNGVFEKGFITLPGPGWRAADSGTAGQRVPVGGTQQSLSTRYVDDRNYINDFGLNFKFNPDDHWAFNVDGQYTHAKHNDDDVSVYGSTFADEELDLTGSIPQAVQHKPLNLAPSWSGSPVSSYLANDTDEQYFKDKQAYFWRAAMDHFARDTGHEYALKGDVSYDFKGDIPFLKRIKFGARYADRSESINETAYNWGAISEVWSGSPVWMDEAGGSNVSLYNWNNFFRGKTTAPSGGYYYNSNLVSNYNAAAKFFDYLNDYWHNQNGATATNRWLPIDQRPGVVPGTIFTPGEMQQTSEKILDFYGMLSYGTDQPFAGDMKISGNVGVRHMSNKLTANGGYTYPTAANSIGSDYATQCAPKTLPSPPNPPGTVAIPTGICQQGEAFFNQALLFYNGATGELPNVTHKYDYWLPSFNLRFDLTNKLLFRFAASRVLAFPDIGYTRNFQNVAYDQNVQRFTVQTGNPNINPALAWTFDLTAEWYFAKVGSLTAGVFQKSIKGFFYSQTVEGSLTNNGVTEAVDIRTPENYNGTGKVRGIEATYQQTFDFLPGLLSGFGVNANFTYLKSKGVPNSYLTDNPSTPATTGSPIGTGRLPLEGLSKYTYNVQGFYEKGPISLRAAWTWRSKNLQTASDVIFPYFPIYNAGYGQLDATIFVNVSKQIKIGLQGTNLTDSIDKTLQQFTIGTDTQKPLLGPRSYFINDRQYALIVRGSF